MNRRHKIVRSGRHNRARCDGFTRFGMPACPETGEGERFTAADLDVNGRLTTFRLFPPFVESVRDDQTPSISVGVAKSGFLSQRFGAGVNHPASDASIFGPAWNQSPTSLPDFASAVIRNHKNVQSRGDIVSRLDFIRENEPFEGELQIRLARVQREPSATSDVDPRNELGDATNIQVDTEQGTGTFPFGRLVVATGCCHIRVGVVITAEG